MTGIFWALLPRLFQRLAAASFKGGETLAQNSGLFLGRTWETLWCLPPAPTSV